MVARDNEFFLPGGPNGVLLIHGLTGTPNEMARVGRDLNRAGFTVLGVQLAGHCGSEADLIATSWRDWTASVADGAARLSQHVQHLFVGGLSMGSVLSMHYAIENPDKVTGLALYGTTFFYDGWSIGPIGRLAFLLPIFDRLGIGKHKSFMESYPYGIKNERIRRSISQKMLGGDSAAAGLPGNPWPAIAEFYRLSRFVQRRLASVRAPCIVVHAREDDVASLKNAELIERRVSGPVEMLVLDESYHMVTVDQQRDVLVDQSINFFNDVVAGKFKAHDDPEIRVV